jgi:5'-methylthioadenosine nucleosidase
MIAIAMEAEAKPFVEHLGLKVVDGFFPKNTPFIAYSGSHGDNSQVTVITNGVDSIYNTGVDNVSTVPSALAVYLALQKLPETKVLINAGTCGGFRRKGAEIGDVFLTTAVTYHDRRIPIPPFVPYGIGKLETKLPYVAELATKYSYKTGICTTGNSLDKTGEDDIHMLANDASVKDMEAAAVAWSCAMWDKPFLGIKVVTDIVDGDVPTQDEFVKNLNEASSRLQAALPKVLDYIIGREHDEL